MELADTLRASHDEVLRDAVDALRRAHLNHYDAAGEREIRDRLDHLFGVVIDCASRETLTPMSSYATTIAEERFHAGFDIAEVQTAFNVIEEAIWHVVVPRLPLDDLAEAAARIGTVTGVGRNALSRTWVSLATGEHVPSLDLMALFEGAGS